MTFQEMFIFKKVSAIYASLNYESLLVILLSKNSVLWKKWLVHLELKTIPQMLFLPQQSYFSKG